MPGSPLYLMPGSYTDTGTVDRVSTPAAGGSHWGFVFWLIVFVLAALAVTGGLKMLGFSFVFRHR